MGMDNDLSEFITEASAIRQNGPRTPLENQVVAALYEIERLRAALTAIEQGCSFPEDDVQRAVRDRARQALQTKDTADYCLWTHDHIDDAWATDCGAYWQFTDGGPRENGINYCHKCSKPVNALDQHDEDCDCDLCGETEKGNGAETVRQR